MSLPACQQRALDRIAQTLVAEDPRRGSRFALFARLTQHEAMPGIEQVRGPRTRPDAVITCPDRGCGHGYRVAEVGSAARRRRDWRTV
jgi:hypothetical protein